MRKSRKFAGVVGLLLVALAGPQLSSGASAVAEPSVSAAGANAYRDYLASDPAATAGGIGSDQCGKPVAGRVGKWWCPAAGGAFADKVRAAVTPNSTGYCNSSGCYNRYDDYHVDFGSNSGNWGYGGRVLGQETHYVNWQLTGAQNVSKPVQYFNSVSTTSVVFTGDLINAAAGQTGTEVPGKFSLYNAGNVPANVVARWNPNGYKSYDNTQFDHSQVHQFSWNFPGYSGYWYSYVKSVVSHSPTKTVYKFNAVNSLPASPYGGGYRA